MLTPMEYIKNGVPENHEIWLNGLDIVAHCLKADTELTLYKDKRPALHHWERWCEEMQKPTTNASTLLDIYDNAYAPKKHYETKFDDSGVFDVGAYISGEDLCFEDERTTRVQKPALSVILDISVPWSSREEKYMEIRHQKVYDLVAQADSDDHPVQVVGMYSRIFPELKKPLTMCLVIKDYSDQIFPSIWGGIKSNIATNCFLNSIADFFIGTSAITNGNKAAITNAEKFFPDNEEMVIFSEGTITANNATIIGD